MTAGTDSYEPAQRRLSQFLAELQTTGGGGSEDVLRRADLDRELAGRKFCSFSFANRGSTYELCLESIDAPVTDEAIVVLDGQESTCAQALTEIRGWPSWPGRRQ
jgi:hypothetical protein